jgi:hypothetical protein
VPQIRYLRYSPKIRVQDHLLALGIGAKEDQPTLVYGAAILICGVREPCFHLIDVILEVIDLGSKSGGGGRRRAGRRDGNGTHLNDVAHTVFEREWEELAEWVHGAVLLGRVSADFR